MDVLMELAWKDPRLAYDEAALQGRKTKRIDVNEIWSPGVSITNSQNVRGAPQEGAGRVLVCGPHLHSPPPSSRSRAWSSPTQAWRRTARCAMCAAWTPSW